MEVLIHVAKDHQEKVELKTNTPKPDRLEEQPRFVFNESMNIDVMLDEFL